jgi:hypothetical protein
MRKGGSARPVVREARGVTDSSGYSGQVRRNMAYGVGKRMNDDMWGIWRDFRGHPVV